MTTKQKLPLPGGDRVYLAGTPILMGLLQHAESRMWWDVGVSTNQLGKWNHIGRLRTYWPRYDERNWYAAGWCSTEEAQHVVLQAAKKMWREYKRLLMRSGKTLKKQIEKDLTKLERMP